MNKSVSGSITQTAYEKLHHAILTGVLKPGERLKIVDLCQSMELNLSAVRESLSRLSSQGLVVSEPQKGFRVAPISLKDLQDVTIARTEIEILCLKRSIQLGDVDWEARIVAAYHTLSHLFRDEMPTDKESADKWWKAHENFHYSLCSACDSVWMLRMRDMLYVQSERYRQLSTKPKSPRRASASEHQELMAAVLARDVDRTVALITNHLQLTMKNLVISLDGETDLS